MTADKVLLLKISLCQGSSILTIMNMINTQIFDLVPKTFNDSHFEVFAYHLSLKVLHWFQFGESEIGDILFIST